MVEYYSFDKILSRNSVYNFIVGGRGIGKTYGAIKASINRYIKKGEQFIYLRRYTKELAVSKANFFNEVSQEFPQYGFRVNGSAGEITKDGKKWETICYFVSLSTAQSQKSVNYHKVTRIIFDEFIAEGSFARYLKSEVNVFNSFYSTVDRWKDKTTVLFLANAVSVINPYFVEYNINPDLEMSKYYNGFISVHIVDSQEFMRQAELTRFGKFIAHTDYAEFAMSNKFKDNTGVFIEKKTPNAAYFITLKFAQGELHYWLDSQTRTYYASTKCPPDTFRACLRPQHADEITTYLQRTDPLVTRLRGAYRHGRMRFETPLQRELAMELFKS